MTTVTTVKDNKLFIFALLVTRITKWYLTLFHFIFFAHSLLFSYRYKSIQKTNLISIHLIHNSMYIKQSISNQK